MSQSRKPATVVFLFAGLLALILFLSTAIDLEESWREPAEQPTCHGLACEGVPSYQKTLLLVAATSIFLCLLGLLIAFVSAILKATHNKAIATATEAQEQQAQSKTDGEA